MGRQADGNEEDASTLASIGEPEPPKISFDELISNLSRAFVRVPVGEIDNELNHWLKSIILALGLDRSTLAQFDPNTGSASFTHGWARERDQLIGPALDADALLPWLRTKMLAGE